PARLVSNRACIRRGVVQRAIGLQRDGAVIAQPLGPVFVAGLERLLDEYAAESRAIDEQVALDALTGVHDDGFDETGLRVLHDAADLHLDALDALRLAALAQIACVQRRIEVIGVVDPRFRRGEELVLARGLVFEAIVAELVAESRRRRREPQVMEIAEPGALAQDTKGMNVTVAEPRPVFERDAELDRTARHAEELALVEIENLVEGTDGGERGFAHTHGADLFRFDQRDVDQRA